MHRVRVALLWAVVSACGVDDELDPVGEATSTSGAESSGSEATSGGASTSSSSGDASGSESSAGAESSTGSSSGGDGTSEGGESESGSSGEALGCEAVCAKAYACGYDSCVCNDSFPVECFACWLESTCEQIADYACYDPCN